LADFGSGPTSQHQLQMPFIDQSHAKQVDVGRATLQKRDISKGGLSSQVPLTLRPTGGQGICQCFHITETIING
jgi:hypothetical protein